MELPPLSPGIQERVIDVVVVLVTVRRGWSGGTGGKKMDKAHKNQKLISEKNLDMKRSFTASVSEGWNRNVVMV